MTKYPFLIILIFCSFTVVAQKPVPIETNNGDDVYNDIEKNQIENLYKFYSNRIESSYELISGREYNPYFFQSKLKPLLFIDRQHQSSITLKGRIYNDIPLNYDTYKDEVIYVDSVHHFAYRPYGMILNKDNIDYFDFYYLDDTISFRYLSKEDNPGFDLQNGFYEVVYDGKSKYLIKHRSSAYERDLVVEYYYTPVGYINVGNGFIKIRSTSQFIRLFGDRSRDIRKYIKKSGTKLRTANKRQVMSILIFYDGLKTIPD